MKTLDHGSIEGFAPRADSCRPCPACGNTAVAEIATVSNKTDCLSQPLRLATCSACGLQFQPVVPTPEELRRWYEYMGHMPELFTLTPLLRRRLQRMLPPLEPFRSTARLLEVGCGGGLFLKVAASKGWAVHASEVSASCCARLRPSLGDRLHEGELFNAPFAEASFDVVVMIEVVEHLANPADYLQHVFKLLRPGGALFMTTPNRGGLSAALLGDRWRCIAAEHLSYFAPRSMSELLMRVGFEGIRHQTSYLDVKNLVFGDTSHSHEPPPVAVTPTPIQTSWRDQAQAVVKDLCIEAANVAIAASHRGDTLRTLARRPPA